MVRYAPTDGYTVSSALLSCFACELAAGQNAEVTKYSNCTGSSTITSFCDSKYSDSFLVLTAFCGIIQHFHFHFGYHVSPLFYTACMVSQPLLGKSIFETLIFIITVFMCLKGFYMPISIRFFCEYLTGKTTDFSFASTSLILINFATGLQMFYDVVFILWSSYTVICWTFE